MTSKVREGFDQQAKRIKEFMFGDDNHYTNELAAIQHAKQNIVLTQPQSLEGENKIPFDKTNKDSV